MLTTVQKMMKNSFDKQNIHIYKFHIFIFLKDIEQENCVIIFNAEKESYENVNLILMKRRKRSPR